jgi:cob(I)alamin adenosyltransferase
MVALSRTDDEAVSAPALKYINRLPDLLFVAARYANDRGEADVLWVPGKNR